MLRSLWSQIDYDDLARFFSTAGKHPAALEACAAGLRLRPGDPTLLLRRAQAHDGLGEYERTIADCADALRCEPPPRIAAEIAITLALALEDAGEFAAAREAARIAVGFAPGDPGIHAVYGNLLAWHGDLIAAWPQIECHWLRERTGFARRFGRPEWNGEDLRGKRVVVVHGQGLGDMIQMARYLPRLRERAAHVTLECPATLRRLLGEAPGVDAIAERGSVSPHDVDAFVRLMSLPRLFGETGSAPGATPHLRVPPPRAPGDGALRVGLAWAGNPFHARDRERSLALAACASWASIPGIRWTSLQIGPRANEADASALELLRYDAVVDDLADTATIVARLDLVIAVDTAVAHLAGALGTPVWLLLPRRPDWRWQRASDVTPWYPTMRLLHARGPSWTSTIADVERRLRALTERTQRISADRVRKSAERSKVRDLEPRKATSSCGRGRRTLVDN